ncbi:MAG: SMP-30/gluconolactonase/LRE family protein, partial [Sulfolobaceae archaeon]|nr:SMP-30/gluconolactonase/LRE family protein [Sulfolobaceae archaeon]
PVYDDLTNRLYWIDILGKKLIYLDISTGVETIIETPDMISSLCVIDEKRVIATIMHSFYIIDIEKKKFEKIAEVKEEKQNTRFNDGKCDPLGRYWAGTMDMKEKEPIGALYKLDLDKKIYKILEGLTISNGLAWSLDNKKLYLIDSPPKKVYQMDFNLEKGTVENRRVALDLTQEQGVPDGMTIDEEGMLWIAHHGGGKVTRWDPEKGKKLEEIKLPVTYVTSVTFGGTDLKDLYITTRSHDPQTGGLVNEPLAGKLFRERVGIRGAKLYRFKL